MGRRVLVWVIAGLVASVTACGHREAAGTAVTTTIAATTTTEVASTMTVQPVAVTENGLEYASWGNWTLTLDMHVPAKPAGAPIVVYLPGVIWSPLPLPAETAEGLVEAGAILFVVRYAAEATFDNGAILDGHGVRARAMADSVACAIHFALVRASELGSDDPVVVLTGFSLGGGVAAHVALFGTTLETRWDQYATEGGPASDVDCQVAGGSTDVDALVGIAGEYDVFVPTFEAAYGSAYQQEHDPELWGFLSEAVGVNPDLKVRLIHGTTDAPVPYEKSADFAAMLTGDGYDVEFASWDGGHSVPSELAVETIKEVLQW